MKLTRTLVALVFLSPLVLLALIMLFRFRVEPLADLALMYGLFFLVFSTSAISLAIYQAFPKTPRNVVGYAVAGAICPTVLFVSADIFDDYFSPGVTLIYPLAGAVLGSMFGASFRAIQYFTSR